MMVEPCSNQPISSPLRERRVAGDLVRPAVAQVQAHVERSAGGCSPPGSRPPARAASAMAARPEPQRAAPRARCGRTALDALQRDRVHVPGIAREVGDVLDRAVVRRMEAVVHARGQAQRDVAAVAERSRQPAASPNSSSSVYGEALGLEHARALHRPQAPTIASQGLASTSGSAVDRPRAGLELAREAVVQAGEARFRASLRSRSANSRQSAIDSRAQQRAARAC